jgi:cytoskeleton protein RodZ
MIQRPVVQEKASPHVPAASPLQAPAPAPQPQMVQTEPVRTEPAQTQPAQTQPSQDVPITADTDSLSGVALNLSATEKTWLSVTSGGRQIFSGVLEPSETKVLTGLEMAQMKVGNAGGIEVQWNGKPIGPIGLRGEVRVVVFTQDNVEILPSYPPPAASL